MLTQALSLISVIVALSAVIVAVLAARHNARAAARSRALPIIFDVFREWRSPELLQHKSRLLALNGITPPDGGFDALPAEVRQSAYAWCLFCDCMGQMALYRIVSEDIIIGFIGTQLVQIWCIMEPFIEKEREHRARILPPGAPAGFLPHYEHLVARVAQRGGRTASENIRKTYSVQALTPETRALLSDPAALEAANLPPLRHITQRATAIAHRSSRGAP